MKTILLALEDDTLSQAQLSQLSEQVPNAKIIITRDRKNIESVLDEVEIAAGWFPVELLSKAANLRWFQQWAAGADWLSEHPEVSQSELIITSACGVHSVCVSEHIMAFLLSFGRRLNLAMRAQQQCKWKPLGGDSGIFELAGKTMVLVGVGAIGERTAKVASALGMRVLGVRRNAAIGAAGVEAMFGPAELLGLLGRADFVVLTVPLTLQSEGIIGEKQLRAMKPSAYIINVGRGRTIREKALIRALKEGWIAGAGLDVFQTEPLPENSPLWRMDNVIITSHYSGSTPQYNSRAMEIFLDNLRRYQANEPLRNVVDKKLGY